MVTRCHVHDLEEGEIIMIYSSLQNTAILVQQLKAIFLANPVSSDKVFFCEDYIYIFFLDASESAVALIRSRWVWSCYPWEI